VIDFLGLKMVPQANPGPGKKEVIEFSQRSNNLTQLPDFSLFIDE
jgi:hypothetical protein